MNDPFEKKVRAAAVAGWWVILIAYTLLARWLAGLDKNGSRDRYFDPPLTDEEPRIADLARWIFGVC